MNLLGAWNKSTHDFDKNLDSHSNTLLTLYILSGCKESQFYSLPFGQAGANMY